MTTVSVRELKNRLSEYLRRLDEGEQITVTKRGKPVAVILPAGREESPEERLRRKLQELQAQGIIHWAGGKPKGLTPGVKMTPGPSASDIVIQQRE